jgi:hypothetical protein
VKAKCDQVPGGVHGERYEDRSAAKKGPFQQKPGHLVVGAWVAADHMDQPTKRLSTTNCDTTSVTTTNAAQRLAADRPRELIGLVRSIIRPSGSSTTRAKWTRRPL